MKAALVIGWGALSCSRVPDEKSSAPPAVSPSFVPSNPAGGGSRPPFLGQRTPENPPLRPLHPTGMRSGTTCAAESYCNIEHAHSADKWGCAWPRGEALHFFPLSMDRQFSARPSHISVLFPERALTASIITGAPAAAATEQPPPRAHHGAPGPAPRAVGGQPLQ